MPYLFNIRKLPETYIISITGSWLKKCDLERSLDFNADYLIRQNIRSSKKCRYLPISYSNLMSENKELFEVISGSR